MSDAESGVRLPAATTSAKGASAKSIRRRLRKFAKKLWREAEKSAMEGGRNDRQTRAAMLPPWSLVGYWRSRGGG